MKWNPFNYLARRERIGAPAKTEEIVPKLTTARDRADMARDSRDWRRAADLYREHLTANPGDFGIWVQMGHCEKEAGNFAEAEVCYRSALELSPDDADLWLQIGHLKKLLLRFEEAAAAYRKSLLLDPDQKPAKGELSWLENVLSSFTYARVTAERPVEDRQPQETKVLAAPIATIGAERATDSGALNAAAEAAVRSGNPLLAVCITRLILRNDPLNRALWLRLGDLFDALARPEDAGACRAAAHSLRDRREESHQELENNVGGCDFVSHALS